MLQVLHGDGQSRAAGMVEKKQAIAQIFEQDLITDEPQARVCQKIRVIIPYSPAGRALFKHLLLYLLHFGPFCRLFFAQGRNIRSRAAQTVDQRQLLVFAQLCPV
jgi:hypothetical protein